MADLTLNMKAQDEASPKLKAIARNTEALGKKTEQAAKEVKQGGESIAGGVLKAELAFAALSKAADLALSAIKNGFQGVIEAEQADLRLAAALRQLGYESSSMLPALKAQADTFEALTLVKAEEVQALQGLLLQYGTAPRDIGKVTQALLDYSAATGKSATAAAETLMQALIQGGEEMRAFGIKVQKTGDRGKDLNTIVEEMTRQFGGTAAAAGSEGLGGKLGQLSLQWDKLTESITRWLNSTGLTTSVIESATSAFAKMTKGFEAMADPVTRELLIIQEGLDDLREKHREVSEDLREESGRIFLNDLHKDAVLGPLRAEKEALEEQIRNISTAKRNLLNLQRKLDEREVEALDQGASKKAKVIEAGGKKVVASIERSAEEIRQSRESIKQGMLAALGIDDETLEIEERNLKEAQDLLKSGQEAFRDAWAQLAAQTKQKQQEASAAIGVLLGVNERFIGDFVAKTNAHQQDVRNAGMALGYSLIGGLETALMQSQGGGEVDVASIIASIVPAAVTLAVIAAGGPAAAAYAPLVGQAAGMLVRAGLSSVGGGNERRGGRFHNGGLVDTRPRFHDGGLASDEVSAVLQTGEVVFSRQDVARAGGPSKVEAMRQGGGGGTLVIQAMDAQSFSGFMGGRGGSGLTRTFYESRGEAAQLLRRLARAR